MFWKNVLKIKDTDYCICSLCNKKYRCNVRNGKAVKLHMVNVHNYEEVQAKVNSDSLNQDLFKFITFNAVSTTILDSPEFRRFCLKLGYTVPRREVYNDYLFSETEKVRVYLFNIIYIRKN